MTLASGKQNPNEYAMSDEVGHLDGGWVSGRAWSVVWQPDWQTVRDWPFAAGRTATITLRR